MDTSLYESEDKTQRRRMIIIVTLIGLIVLAIAAWAIIAITDSSNTTKNTTKNTEVAVDDGTANANANANTNANTSANTNDKTEGPRFLDGASE